MSEYEYIPGLEDTYLNADFKPTAVCDWCKKPIDGKVYGGRYHQNCWDKWAETLDEEDE